MSDKTQHLAVAKTRAVKGREDSLQEMQRLAMFYT